MLCGLRLPSFSVSVAHWAKQHCLCRRCSVCSLLILNMFAVGSELVIMTKGHRCVGKEMGLFSVPPFVPWLPSPPPSHLLPSFSRPTPYIPNDFQVWLLALAPKTPSWGCWVCASTNTRPKMGVGGGMGDATQAQHQGRWGERKLWSVVDKTSK